jgi:hypothetical protein
MSTLPQMKRTPLNRSKKRIKRAKPGTLKNKLTAAFNAMIRERDRQLLCISCQEREMTEAGHFVGCTPLATRWHPQNVNGQCNYCNAWQSGNKFAYGLNLNKKWGEGTAEKLERLGRTYWKPSREALEALLATAKIGHEAYQETWNFYGAK